MEAFVIAKGHLRLESHFSKEHHRSKLHDLNSKSDQKSIESIDQPNGKSTNKLQDVKSIVCLHKIDLTWHGEESMENGNVKQKQVDCQHCDQKFSSDLQLNIHYKLGNGVPINVKRVTNVFPKKGVSFLYTYCECNSQSDEMDLRFQSILRKSHLLTISFQNLNGHSTCQYCHAEFPYTL